MPTPEKHAFLNASAAHRWLNCTAAPHYEEQFPASTSSYAEEGTLAHSICELYARKQFTPMSTRKFNSSLKKLKEQPLYSDEMLRTAQVYQEVLSEKAMAYASTPYVTQEVRVDYSDYVPEGFGTCDCVMIGGDTLRIFDYKHGKGVPVAAENNPQMRLYALGALKMFTPVFGDSIKRVITAIIQPRLFEEPSEEELTKDELIAWGHSIMPAAHEAYIGPGRFSPGEHCRFCRGKTRCRARAEHNTAFEDFKGCVPIGRVDPAQQALAPEARSVLGLPPVLTDAEIGELLIRGQSLVQWYKDLETYATDNLLAGKPIPGWKLVEGRSNRAFKDADAAVQVVTAAGYDEALCYTRKPLTLTGFEDLLGKKKFAELLVDTGHVIKPPGKPTLALESDKRAPYSSAAADFAGVAGASDG